MQNGENVANNRPKLLTCHLWTMNIMQVNFLNFYHVKGDGSGFRCYTCRATTLIHGFKAKSINFMNKERKKENNTSQSALLGRQ